MIIYNNFIGIDIGKFNFVVALHGDKNTKEYKNNAQGVKEFIEDYHLLLEESLCVMETTGGYEMEALLILRGRGFPVHRANTRKVKNFIRSLGNGAKSDNLDAKALALYGFERADRLEIFNPKSVLAKSLYELSVRRNDLKQMLVAEKNRIQSPGANLIKKSCKKLIDFITAQIGEITEKINALISDNQELKQKKEILKSIPGIGDIVANDLLILLPEIGSLNRRQIASLAGLAPRSNDSGTLKGYRRTAPGRNIVKPILFIAAMAARNSKSNLRLYYESLIGRGKKKMVALVALMRKIIVIANARLRDLTLSNMAIKV